MARVLTGYCVISERAANQTHHRKAHIISITHRRTRSLGHQGFSQLKRNPIGRVALSGVYTRAHHQLCEAGPQSQVSVSHG